MKYLALVIFLFSSTLKADIELGAFQSLARIYSIDGASSPTKLRSNLAYGVSFSGDLKFSETKFFEYGLSGKVFLFNSPKEAKLENGFSSINEYFLGIKKINAEEVYRFRLGYENFLFYRYKDERYQIVRANPLKASISFQNKLVQLKDLKYETSWKFLLPSGDMRDSGKVGYGTKLRISYDMRIDEANFSPFVESEYSIKKIKDVSYSRLDLTIGFNIVIDIREKKSKLF